MKLSFFESFLRNKSVIKAIFIFPLISCALMGILIKAFVDAHSTLPYIDVVTRLFMLILCVLFINMIANFISLVLYYCLTNRIENLTKGIKKKD